MYIMGSLQNQLLGGNQPVDESVDQTIDQSVDQTTDQPVIETIDQSVDQTIDQSVDQTIDQSVDQTIDQSVDQTTDQPVVETIDQSVDQTIDQPVVETIDQSVDQTIDQPVDESVDQSVDQPVDQTTDQPVDESVDQPVVDTTDQLTDQTTDQPVVEESVDQPTDQTTDQSVDQTIDQPVVDTTDQPVVETTDQPVDQSVVEESVNQPILSTEDMFAAAATSSALVEESLSQKEYLDKFLYLNDNLLSRVFELCKEDPSKKQSVYLCIYHIQTTCSYENNRLPFLKFLMEKTPDKTYSFPVFEYECLADSEDNETNFHNQCFSQILSTLDLSPESISVDTQSFFDTAYKGLVTQSDSVFAVFDYSEIIKYFNHKHTSPSADLTNIHLWGIVDELIFEKKINEFGVDPIITAMFDDHDYMWNISFNGSFLEYFPFSLYLVLSEDETKPVLVNERRPENKTDALSAMQTIMPVGTTLDLYSLADIYGERYCFTSQPIETGNYKNIVRYAVFTPKPKFLTEETPKNEEKTEDEIGEEEIDNLTEEVIYFKEGEIQMWGILSNDLFAKL